MLRTVQLRLTDGAVYTKDFEAGASYLQLTDRTVTRTTEHGPINLDWDDDGGLVGIEYVGILP